MAERSPPGHRPRERGGRTRRRRRRSDLGARIAVAVPAAVVAIVFVDLGGPAFALFMIALGCICLHELYRMLERWKPVPLAGFAALAGMVLAARFGGQFQVLLVAVATVPVLFLMVLGRQGGGATVAIAGTLLGVYW